MRRIAVALVLVGVAAASLSAQGRGRGRYGEAAQGIPPGHLPPPGSCRIWYDALPPGQQPPPTSCAEAERVAYRDPYARVIERYGSKDAYRDVYREGYDNGYRDTAGGVTNRGRGAFPG